MECKYCKALMILDDVDVDFNHKRNKDNYFICDNCDASALEKIRLGVTVSVSFKSGEKERKQ